MSEQWTISRRNFFKVTGLSGASLWLPGCDFELEIVPSLSAVLTRREDLVSLRFEFANLQLVPNAAGPELVHDGSGVGYIIVHFAPQHLEQAVDENAVAPSWAAAASGVGVAASAGDARSRGRAARLQGAGQSSADSVYRAGLLEALARSS